MVEELFHKTQKILFPAFTDFVKKNRENVAIDFFQFKIDGDGKKPLKTVITNFFTNIIQEFKPYSNRNEILKAKN